MLTVEEDITYALMPCPVCGKMSDPAYFREHALYAWQTERRDG